MTSRPWESLGLRPRDPLGPGRYYFFFNNALVGILILFYSRGPRYVTTVGTDPIVAHESPKITHLEGSFVYQNTKIGFICEKVFENSPKTQNKCFIFQNVLF